MIQRNRDNIKIPITLTGPNCISELETIVNKISSGNKVQIKSGKANISSAYYRGNQIDKSNKVIQDVFLALADLYNNKCAFCESKRFAPDIEHFRPKKKVSKVKGHHGYYWLCYEWTNLIPSCSECNKIKLNKFPIFDEFNRIYSPTFLLDRSIDRSKNLYSTTPLKNEQPYLIHPEYDNPVLFFKYDNEGRMFGIDKLQRGKKTIGICGLNRPDLLFFRGKIVDSCLELCELALCNNNDYYYKKVLDKIRSRGLNKNEEYTQFIIYIYNNFNEIIVPLLPFPIQHRAEDVYLKEFNPII